MSPAPAVRARVVLIGNFTVDDIVHPDGSTVMGTAGGNVVYSSVAARLWHDDVAVVARSGHDLPTEIPDTLAALGIDVSAIGYDPGPTVRCWVLEEPDGRRHFIDRTAPGRSAELAVRPRDLPQLDRSPGRLFIHLNAMPLPAAAALVEAIRLATPTAYLTMDTHEAWSDDLPALLAVARHVDVLIPSLAELASLVGHRDAAAGARQLVAAGVGQVVVKLGGAGALICTDEQVQELPAWPVTVADTTGAGDTFCGALVAALAGGDDLLEATGKAIATAGWSVQTHGSLALAKLTQAQAEHRYQFGAKQSPSQPQNDQPGTDRYDIDVMRREIETIPDVLARHLSDPDSHVARIAQLLADRQITNLVITGCGDSHFAGMASVLTFDRHAAVPTRAVHAMTLARYDVRYLPPGSAVLCISVSGKVGRTTEAAIQARRFGHLAIALTNNPDGSLARAADELLLMDVATLGFSPGTSTYLGLLATLNELALQWGAARGRQVDTARKQLDEIAGLAAQVLTWNTDVAVHAAARIAAQPWTAFLGAGPNEASARFGAAKLFEGPQLVGVAANLEEWAHEEYFVTEPGAHAVLIAPAGASADRAADIVSELNFIGAKAIVISDLAFDSADLLLPLPTGVTEEFSPLLTALPLSLLGFQLAQVLGKRSYNFASEAIRTEHYDTIHRVGIGEPA